MIRSISFCKAKKNAIDADRSSRPTVSQTRLHCVVVAHDVRAASYRFARAHRNNRKRGHRGTAPSPRPRRLGLRGDRSNSADSNPQWAVCRDRPFVTGRSLTSACSNVSRCLRVARTRCPTICGDDAVSCSRWMSMREFHEYEYMLYACSVYDVFINHLHIAVHFRSLVDSTLESIRRPRIMQL